MISLPIWIRHLGVLTYEDSACTDENEGLESPGFCFFMYLLRVGNDSLFLFYFFAKYWKDP